MTRLTRLILAAVAGVALVLGGLVAMQSASADAGPDFGPGYVKGALVQIAVGSPRGTYIDANGIPHCLPSGPNAAAGKSGDYPAMWYSAPNPSCSFGGGGGVGPAGPAGPKGDKGEPGASSLAFGHGEVVIGANGTYTVTITGQPPYSALIGKRTLVTTNFGERPDGTTLDVSPAVPAAGSTSRTYTVVATGWAGATPDFRAEIDTVSAVAPAA